MWDCTGCTNRQDCADFTRQRIAALRAGYRDGREQLRREQLGVLPEFGNLWPLYLMAGSIGLWLWSSRKA
jgi:hypothetical protein